MAGAHGEASHTFVGGSAGDLKLGREVTPTVASFAVGSTLEVGGATVGTFDDTGLDAYGGVEVELNDHFAVALESVTLAVKRSTDFATGAVSIAAAGVAASATYTVVGGLALHFFDAPDDHTFVVACPAAGLGFLSGDHVGTSRCGSSFTSGTFGSTVGLGSGVVAGLAVLATAGTFAGVGGGVTGFIAGCVAVAIGQASNTSTGGGVALGSSSVSSTICISSTLGGASGNTVAFRSVTGLTGCTSAVVGAGGRGLAKAFGGVCCGREALLGISTI